MNSRASSPAARRSYTLGKRAVAAQATRDAILAAAKTLAAAHGLASLTVEAVADEAGVSRLTVYNHFESKAGLLEALAWALFAAADIARIRDARLHPDLDVALPSFLAENAQFFATIGSSGRSVLTAALGDPDLAAVIDATYIAGRLAAITSLVERLAREGRLARRWTPEDAVACLMVLTSLEAFETMTAGDQRTPAEAGAALAAMSNVLLTTKRSHSDPRPGRTRRT